MKDVYITDRAKNSEEKIKKMKKSNLNLINKEVKYGNGQILNVCHY